MTRIAILGAAGAMAEVVRRDLAQFAPEAAVTIVDLKELAANYPNERPATVDVRDEAATARLLAGHDAVLNCVTYYWNLPVMRAALAARVPVQRPGRPLPRDAEAVRASRRVRRRRGTGAPRHGLDAGDYQRHGGLPGARARRGARGACAGRLPRPRGVPGRCPSPTRSTRCSTSSHSSRMSSRTARRIRCRQGAAKRRSTSRRRWGGCARSTPCTRKWRCSRAPSRDSPVRASRWRSSRASWRRSRFLVELGFAGREPCLDGVSPRQMLLALGAAQVAPGGAPDDCDCLRVDLAGEIDGRAVRRRGEVGHRTAPRVGLRRRRPRHRRAARHRRRPARRACRLDSGRPLPGDRAALRTLLRRAREARHPGRFHGTGPTGRMKEGRERGETWRLHR